MTDDEAYAAQTKDLPVIDLLQSLRIMERGVIEQQSDGDLLLMMQSLATVQREINGEQRRRHGEVHVIKRETVNG